MLNKIQIELGNMVNMNINEVKICDIPKTKEQLSKFKYKTIMFTGVLWHKKTIIIKEHNIFFIELYISDCSDTIIINKHIKAEDLEFYNSKIIKCSKVQVIGSVEYDLNINKIVVRLQEITVLGMYNDKVNIDNAPVKRVELHAYAKTIKTSGLTTASEYIEYAKTLGWKSIAIANKNDVYHFKEIIGENEEFKPIYGMELSFIDDSRYEKMKYESVHSICILALNENGRKNIYKVLYNALENIINGKMAVFKSVIDKYRNDLFIGINVLDDSVLRVDAYELIDLISYFDYVEVTPPENNYWVGINEYIKKIIEVSKQLNKIVVAVSECKYLRYEQQKYYEILTNKKQPKLHLKTTNEMLESFNFLGDELAYEIVVTNTNLIANKIKMF